jgi:uncharacterized protein
MKSTHFYGRSGPAVRAFICAAALFALALPLDPAAGQPAGQAKEPSPAAVATAKELIEVKGATHMFDPVVPGVIETAKNMFLQTNPQLSKDLNEVAAQLRNELAAKRGEITDQVARIYAARFTEPELKEALAFYKTPLGKKLVSEEVVVLEQSMTRIQSWADRFSEEAVSRIRAEMRKRGHTL